MAEPKDQSAGESWGEGISPVEQKAAQEVTLAFLMAVKNYGLFPPDHASTINMLSALSATLGGFAERHGALRLTIEKSRIRYEDEVIFEEPNPDNNPAFIFFRDGLLWLEFLPGLSPHEVLAFFRIISRFKLTQEEPEGDLVTELWSAALEHINYGATENLWEAEPVLEFSLLNPDARAVLDYGFAAVPGFDLLKSVPGVNNFAGGHESGGCGGSGDAVTGGGGGGLGAGFWSGGGPADGGPAGDGLGGGGPAGGGPAGGGSAGSGLAGDTAGGFGQPLPEENLDGLDFWATLQRLNTPAPGLGGVGGTSQVGGGEGSGPDLTGGQGTNLPQHKSTDGAAVYTATGQIPPVVGDAKPGAHGRSLRRATGAEMAVPGGGGGATAAVADRKATAFSRPGRGGDWAGDGGEEESYISVNVASIEPGHSLWQFTKEEQAELARMVRAHEEDDNSADIIELLLILLRMENEPPIVSAILAFLKDEFRITLSGRRFDIGHVLLVKVNDFIRELPPEKDWVQPMVGHFSEEIVEPEVLDALRSWWPELPVQKPEVLQDFSAILQLLSPRAGVALTPMVAQVKAGIGRRILIDMIAFFASRDLAIIEKMLDRPEEDLITRLIHVLREAADQRQAEPLLFKALKYPKDQVRLEVVTILLERNCEQYDRIFQLIHDPCPDIREAVFLYIGGGRNRELETLFLNYLGSERFMGKDREHIANCYLTLGLCGSDESLPLLKRVLFGQPWNFLIGIGTAVHREGAAIALNKLRTRAGRALLQEAEYSTFSHIRKAWRLATGN